MKASIAYTITATLSSGEIDVFCVMLLAALWSLPYTAIVMHHLVGQLEVLEVTLWLTIIKIIC